MDLLARPIEVETLDSWAKWLEDIAKIAAVVIPLVSIWALWLIIQICKFRFINNWRLCNTSDS